MVGYGELLRRGSQGDWTPRRGAGPGEGLAGLHLPQRGHAPGPPADHRLGRANAPAAHGPGPAHRAGGDARPAAGDARDVLPRGLLPRPDRADRRDGEAAPDGDARLAADPPPLAPAGRGRAPPDDAGDFHPLLPGHRPLPLARTSSSSGSTPSTPPASCGSPGSTCVTPATPSSSASTAMRCGRATRSWGRCRPRSRWGRTTGSSPSPSTSARRDSSPIGWRSPWWWSSACWPSWPSRPAGWDCSPPWTRSPQAQIDAYNRDGYSFPHQALTDSELADCRDGLARYEAWLGTPVNHGDWRWRSAAYAFLPWLDGLIRHPRILDAVEDLIGPDILVFTTTFFIKDANSPTFAAWHQDATYFGIEPYEHVTAWVALTDATEEAGCMEVVPSRGRRGSCATPRSACKTASMAAASRSSTSSTRAAR